MLFKQSIYVTRAFWDSAPRKIPKQCRCHLHSGGSQ